MTRARTPFVYDAISDVALMLAIGFVRPQTLDQDRSSCTCVDVLASYP